MVHGLPCGKGGPFMDAEKSQMLVQAILNLAPLMSKVVSKRLISDLDVSPTQFQAMMMLKLDAPLSMTALAEALQISKQQLTNVAEGLVQKGYITRRESPENRRVLLIDLTESGIGMLERNLEDRAKLLTEILSDITNEQQDILLQAFSILNDVLTHKNAGA